MGEYIKSCLSPQTFKAGGVGLFFGGAGGVACWREEGWEDEKKDEERDAVQ